METILTGQRTAFRRYETVHERKYEWYGPGPDAALPLYPTGIGYSRLGPGAVQVRKSHPGFSVEVLLAGGLVYYSEGRHLRLRPGDVLLKHVGSAYRLRPPRGLSCHKGHVGLAGAALPLLLDCWGLGGERAVRFATVDQPRAALARLYGAAAAGRPLGELGEHCYQLLTLLASGRPRRQRPAALASALDHMRHHLAEPLTVASIAAQAGTTPTGLHRLFRDHLETTPIAWLLEHRLARAAELLCADQRLLIKQVARSCGFPDQRYFARLFRRRYGCPPGAWRRSPAASR